MDYATDGNFHLDFIELLAKRMKPDIYLELGLGPDAECMKRVRGYCLRALGVDKEIPRESFRAEFFHMSTKEFFTHLQVIDFALGSIDLCLIDADHSQVQVEGDFFAVLPYMKEDGLILLHDTYPANEEMCAPGYSGDCWKAARDLCLVLGSYNLEIVTLPFPPGLTIVRKRSKHLLWRD